MNTKPTAEEELKALEAELKALYIAVADGYKRMSKVSDEWRLSGLQEGIDSTHKRTLELRPRIAALRKYIVDNWRTLK